MKPSLKDEKCPHCGSVGGLFRCSFGAINCADCMQYVGPYSEWLKKNVKVVVSGPINGQQFDYPKFDDFLPHFHALNIGGQHLGVDTARTSEDRFDKEGRPQWKADKDRATIALEEIKAEIDKFFPGSTALEKKAKIALAEKVFGTASGTKIEGMSYLILEQGLKRIRNIFTVPENTPDNISKGIIQEPPDEDIPADLGDMTTDQLFDATGTNGR